MDAGVPRWLYVALGVFMGLLVLFVGSIVACNAALDWSEQCSDQYLTPGDLKALLPPPPGDFRRTHQSQESCRDNFGVTPASVDTTYETNLSPAEAMERYRAAAFEAGWLQRDLYPAGIVAGATPGSKAWTPSTNQHEPAARMRAQALPPAGTAKTVIVVRMWGYESMRTR